jgi:hypothetical protein
MFRLPVVLAKFTRAAFKYLKMSEPDTTGYSRLHAPPPTTPSAG